MTGSAHRLMPVRDMYSEALKILAMKTSKNAETANATDKSH